MTEEICRRVNVTVTSVSEFELCLKSVTHKRNEIIESIEYYLNSSFAPISVQWLEYFDPSKIFLEYDMNIQGDLMD